MMLPESVSDEPLTPSDRMFFYSEVATVVHIAVGMKHPIDIPAMKAAMKESEMVKHPRFRSLMVRDSHGIEHWRKTEIDIDRHIIVVDEKTEAKLINESGSQLDRDEAAVNRYMADMSLSFDLDKSKPLWEIHVLRQSKCMFFRIHHSLGDGMLLMSTIRALFMPAVDGSGSALRPIVSSNGKMPWHRSFAMLVQRVWFTILFVVELIVQSLWVWGQKNPISGGDGVELWPRKIATARFRIDDMKMIKRVVPGATINDVLTGVISTGLHRYFDRKRSSSIESGFRMTGVVAVNLRKQPGLQDLTKLTTNDSNLRCGNMVGFMLLPFYYNPQTETNPLDQITRAKVMLDRKKSSLEAAYSLWSTNVMISWFGAKVSTWFFKNLIYNTTYIVSNMVGPAERLTYIGNPVTYIRASVTSLPHALTMHLLTYAGMADLQILAAKDIVPDPEFLAECFEGALMDMKSAVDERETYQRVQPQKVKKKQSMVAKASDSRKVTATQSTSSTTKFTRLKLSKPNSGHPGREKLNNGHRRAAENHLGIMELEDKKRNLLFGGVWEKRRVG